MSPVDYHAWTHRPKSQGGTDPIPGLAQNTPWILLTAGGQTLPGDGGFDPLLFNGLYWDPALVSLNPADPTDGSDDTFDIDVLTFGGTDYFQPTLRLMGSIGGWYQFEVAADIGDTGDGAAGVFWELDVSPDTSGGAFPDTGHWNEKFIWNGTEQMQDVVQRQWKLWANAQRGYFLQARQNTGVDKDLSGMMMIHYLGQLGGSGDSGDWAFATP